MVKPKLTSRVAGPIATIIIAIAGAMGSQRIMAQQEPAQQSPGASKAMWEALDKLRADLASEKEKRAKMESDLTNVGRYLDRIDSKVDRLLERPR